jgi:hypothetical protein
MTVREKRLREAVGWRMERQRARRIVEGAQSIVVQQLGIRVRSKPIT